MKVSCASCAGRFHPDGRTLYVSAPEDLNVLLRSFRKYDAISILATALSPKARDSAERVLIKLYSECGCATGAASLLLALGTALAIKIIFPELRLAITAFWGVGFCFGAAIIGKLFGIMFARLKLLREVRQVQNASFWDSQVDVLD